MLRNTVHPEDARDNGVQPKADEDYRRFLIEVTLAY